MWDRGPTYIRGGMTLQALREKVGDEALFDIMRTWAAEHRHGTVTTVAFALLCEEKSGMDLDDFFRMWLYESGKPREW